MTVPAATPDRLGHHRARFQFGLAYLLAAMIWISVFLACVTRFGLLGLAIFGLLSWIGIGQSWTRFVVVAVVATFLLASF